MGHNISQARDWNVRGLSSQAMVFPIVMYGWRVGLWRKLSTKELMLLNCGVGEDSWDSLGLPRSNQFILKEISPGCSLEGLLKLKLQYFGHLMQRTDSFEKILMLGKIEGRRRRGQQRMRWLDGITDSMNMNLSNLQQLVWRIGKPGILQSMGSQRVGHDQATELIRMSQPKSRQNLWG